MTDSGVADLGRYEGWIRWLRDAAADDADVRCVWVGGSAVTGGWDDWSDLDVWVLTAPDRYERVYADWVAAFLEDPRVDHVWQLPESTYADGRQCFVNERPRPGALSEPTLLLDLVVHGLSEELRHVDVRRHGPPLVLHDPDHLVVLRHDDDRLLQAAADAAADQVRQRLPTAEWLVNRAVARGQLPEAVDLYLRLGLHPLVRLLRTRLTPARHDFGLRYLDVDLPPEVTARVVSLLPGVDRLAELSGECFAWQRQLLADTAQG